MQHSTPSFLAGLAVWAFPDFFGSFYPKTTARKDGLLEYGKRLQAVECNSTFYAHPSFDTFGKWADAVPNHFQFVPKLHQQISHKGDLSEKIDLAIDQVQRTKGVLGDRCGPFMLQLPPNYGPEKGRDLAIFLNAWRRNELGELAVELRHVAWWEPNWETRVNLLLSRLGMSRVILDTRAIYADPSDPQKECENKKPELPVSFATTNDIVIVRYIAHPLSEQNHKYWESWFEQISQWFSSNKKVYFFMHCPIERHSPFLVRSFHSGLRNFHPPIPELPWNTLPPDSQLSLF